VDLWRERPVLIRRRPNQAPGTGGNSGAGWGDPDFFTMHFVSKFAGMVGLIGLFFLSAAHAAPKAAESQPYTRIAEQRADKIVASLALASPTTAARVRDVIARQYVDLHALHAVRDARIAEAKSLPDRAAATAAATSAKTSVDPQLTALHAAYLARLAEDLSPAQIERVKDGMTYGVLPLTFRVYQQMLPALTAAQKDQILAWLTEARELAMTGSTSSEKHAWFGKYKGRINNYLSAAGYDLKQAEKNLKAQPSPAPLVPPDRP